MTVSVIVPTYNRGKYLRIALRSIISQTRPPEEIIVVDDGSTDDTHAIVAEFGPAVKYLRKINGGKSSALNAGLAAISHKLVWIVDDDDIVYPDALESLVGAFDLASADFVFGDFSTFKARRDRAGFKVQNVVSDTLAKDVLFVNALEKCFTFQPSMLVLASCYGALGGFDETLVRSQDYEMLIRLCGAFRGAYLPRIVFAQRQHEGLRGSAAAPVVASAVARVASQFDQASFRKIYRKYPLTSYLPIEIGRRRSEPQLNIDRLYVRALLMARKCLWDEAGADLEQIQKIYSESRCGPPSKPPVELCTRLFDFQSRTLTEPDKASEFLTRLIRTDAMGESRRLSSALAAGLICEIAKAILRKDESGAKRRMQAAHICNWRAIIRSGWWDVSADVIRHCVALIRRKLRAIMMGTNHQILE